MSESRKSSFCKYGDACQIATFRVSQSSVVQGVDHAIHWRNHNPLDKRFKQNSLHYPVEEIYLNSMQRNSTWLTGVVYYRMFETRKQYYY